MADQSLLLPSSDIRRDHIITSLHMYWKKGAEYLQQLSFRQIETPNIKLPLRLVEFRLPDWASSCGVDGVILVPAEAASANYAGDDWQKVDWWLAAFLMLECWHERVFERHNGTPIHSYSFRLNEWDTRAWDAAWVNRIALFLRKACAYQLQQPETALFGTLPKGSVLVTHDVDAIQKTWPIRIKQTIFLSLNALRFLSQRQWKKAVSSFFKAVRFFFSNENWWVFDKLLRMESEKGIKARFHFYADQRRKTLKSWLFDPSYQLTDQRLGNLFSNIRALGGEIGLHPAFDSWSDSAKYKVQKSHLAKTANQDINVLRQHWLRFSFEKSWSAQEQAGFKEDTTLMFNDRSGFRAAAAVAWRPVETSSSKHIKNLTLTVIPTILMDSHSYDYQPVSDIGRVDILNRWIGEVYAVGGQAAVLWHPHTLTNDYGWSDGFGELLSIVEKAEKSG